MKLNGQIVITAILATLSVAVSPALAVKVKSGVVAKGDAKSGLSGLQSGAGTVTVIDSGVTPSTAAGSGLVFVLTSVCVNAENPGQLITIQSNPPGSVFLRLNSGDNWSNCQHFEPGLIVPAGVDLECNYTQAQNWGCTVSGIVTKE